MICTLPHLVLEVVFKNLISGFIFFVHSDLEKKIEIMFLVSDSMQAF